MILTFGLRFFAICNPRYLLHNTPRGTLWIIANEVSTLLIYQVHYPIGLKIFSNCKALRLFGAVAKGGGGGWWLAKKLYAHHLCITAICTPFMYHCYMHTIYVLLLYAHHLCITVICTPFMYYCYMHTIYVLLLYAHHLCITVICTPFM